MTAPVAETARAAQVVAAAQRWLGTPYVHQASCRGAGCDCLGLVRGVWREVVGAEPASLPPYSADWGEVQGAELLWQGARRLMRELPAAAARPGDVLLFRMRTGAVAKHLGILSRGTAEAAGRFIHAYEATGVIEQALTAAWRRRLAFAFAFPAFPARGGG